MRNGRYCSIRYRHLLLLQQQLLMLLLCQAQLLLLCERLPGQLQRRPSQARGGPPAKARRRDRSERRMLSYGEGSSRCDNPLRARIGKVRRSRLSRHRPSAASEQVRRSGGPRPPWWVGLVRPRSSTGDRVQLKGVGARAAQGRGAGGVRRTGTCAL